MLEFEDNPRIELENLDFFWNNEIQERFSDISSSDLSSDSENIEENSSQNNSDEVQNEPDNRASIQQLYNQGHEVLEGIFVQGYQAGFNQGHNYASHQRIAYGYSLGYQAGIAAQQLFYHQQHVYAQEEASRRLAQQKAEQDRLIAIRAQEELAARIDQIRTEEQQYQQTVGQVQNSILLTDEEKNILSDIFDWN